MQLSGMDCSLLLTHKQTIRGSYHPGQDLTSYFERPFSGKFFTVFIDKTEWNPLNKVPYLGDECHVFRKILMA